MAQSLELNVQSLHHIQRLHLQQDINDRDREVSSSYHPDCLLNTSLFLPNSSSSEEPPYSEGVLPDLSSCTSEMECEDKLTESDDEGIYPPDLEYGLVHTDVFAIADEKVLWETHHVAVYKVPGIGFGIAVSGGRDNPHFTSGESSIAISDVLKGGPADSQLKVNDRVLSINGISMDDARHADAISLLRESGEMVDLLVRRKVILPSPHKKQERTITIEKTKSGAGIEVGCKFYVKGVKGNTNGQVEEGDHILQVNGVSTDGLTLTQTQRMIDRSRGKLNLVVEKPASSSSQLPVSRQCNAADRVYEWTMQQHAASSGYNSPSGSTPFRSRANSKATASGEELRRVSFLKENNSAGLSVVGGNRTGVYISAVDGGGAAQKEGVHQGDLIVQVNGIPVQGLTKEQVIRRIDSLPSRVDLLLTDKSDDYWELFNDPTNCRGDEFYIQACITCQPIDCTNTNQRLFVHPGDIFKVLDTAPASASGSWWAARMDADGAEQECGLIPNRHMAEQMCKRSMSSSTPSSKTFGRHQWKNLIIEPSANDLDTAPDTKAYESVILQEAYLPRPVVIYGALAGLCRHKLMSAYPTQFEMAKVNKVKSGFKSKNILKFSSVRDVANEGKHCLLDLPPHAIDKLINNQFHPIVVHVTSDTAELKDERLLKNMKKSDALTAKITASYPHLISSHVSVKRGRDWIEQVCDIICHEQEKPVWMKERTTPSATSQCSSDYFSLDSSQLHASRGDLRLAQYSSQPCLSAALRDHTPCPSHTGTPPPPARLRSCTDPCRGLNNSMIAELSSPVRTENFPQTSNSSGVQKHESEAAVNGAHYDNRAFEEDEPVLPTNNKFASEKVISGVWFTDRSKTSSLNNNLKRSKTTCGQTELTTYTVQRANSTCSGGLHRMQGRQHTRQILTTGV